jgi:hypothetical protein
MALTRCKRELQAWPDGRRQPRLQRRAAAIAPLAGALTDEAIEPAARASRRASESSNEPPTAISPSQTGTAVASGWVR